MNTIAVVATHHKAGTVWMNATFRAIAEGLDIRFLSAMAFALLAEPERKPPLILTASHGNERHPGLFDREDVRIFHLIRDPRDLLISGMRYHRDAGEQWLLRAEQKFEGRTYREMLAACATERERYAFEMRNALTTTVAELSGWKYDRPNSLECRFEDLIRDTDRKMFSAIARHLGFSKEELPVCRRTFWRNAIFGGKAKRKADGKLAHVRSGEPEQWRAVFDRRLGEAFLAQFGDVLINLGYEKSDAWLESLPEVRPELDTRIPH
ncbi:MAG TPA: sulfotransferase domain-containing protein [Rhizomicrobium sp.]|nr:sulfotransferase domain-containing protein [Rhizomicrobium sp.]